MHQSHLSAIERGSRGLSIEFLIPLAKALDTSTDYLTGLTDDPTPRVTLNEQVILSVTDPVRRDHVQRILDNIERLAPDTRDRYYDILQTLALGIDNYVAQRRTRR
jgi:transcriptional regulator with XRE-family HTH domain